MRSEEFIRWLKDQELFNLVQKNFEVFKKVFTDCLKVDREEVLMIGDLGYPGKRVPALMLGCYVLAAKRLGIKYHLKIQNPINPGSHAEDHIIQALDQLTEENVIVLVTSHKLGKMKKLGSSYRKFIKQRRHKFVSTSSLFEMSTYDFRYLVDSVDVDFAKMQEKGRRIKKILDYAEKVEISTDKGTNLSFDIKNMRAISNDGDYSAYKSGGNIPAGEVYIAPKGKGVEGTVIIDGSLKVREGTFLIKNPIKLKIENGSITKIEGGKEADMLEQTLRNAEQRAKHPWGIRRIGELGIGINSNAKICGPTIINEKTIHTAHIAIGSNVWFGGSIYAIIHLDQVFKDPKIWVDGKKLDVLL